MQISELIYESGIIEEITRLTGASVSVFSNKARVAKINEALDRYWFLASESAPKGTLDDLNKTNLIVNTQNLVNGTNSYKIGSFSDTVLNILKVSILDSNGKEFDLEYEDFEQLTDFTQFYSTAATDRGTPAYWTKLGDYIYMRPCPNYNSTNGLRAYINRALTKFSFTTFTVTIASPAVFTATAHGLAANDAVIFETDGALPTGLTPDTTIYYVISAGLTADAFEVSTTIGGSAVNTSGSQSGNHKFLKVSATPGIPTIHHPYLARYTATEWMGANNAQGQYTTRLNYELPKLQTEEKSIQSYWAHHNKARGNVITTKFRRYK
jgi:hypothetical protein